MSSSDCGFLTVMVSTWATATISVLAGAKAASGEGLGLKLLLGD